MPRIKLLTIQTPTPWGWAARVDRHYGSRRRFRRSLALVPQSSAPSRHK